ncbi:SAM-dependent methyltransferase [Saccharothrix sp. BKS2]|uniref:SAM-dependent methyltransferase n=1 Tax=Saccharothrix sp. BKS2 TaxID=3064400 RepID=UPI0039E91581
MSGAAGTAVGPMVIAAVEQHHPRVRRLLDDPLAASVLPPVSRWVARLARRPRVREWLVDASERNAPGIWGGIACRKRYIDDQVVRALADGIGSVVVLGAGLDTRGHRLVAPAGATAFEVDLPANVERRRGRLGDRDGVVPVPVDLDTGDLGAALAAHGHRVGDRCLFVWEGVTQYLTEEGFLRTFDFLAGAAPGSRVVFTYVRHDFVDGSDRYGADALHRRFVTRQRLWRIGVRPRDVAGLLAGYGWRKVEDVGTEEFLARYVRPTGREVAVSPLERTVLGEKL